jgi:hypothetical protein
MGDWRSTLIHRVRKEVAPQIFHEYHLQDSIVTKLGTDAAAQSERTRELLGYDEETNTYKLIPPCLFAGENAADLTGVFRSLPPMLVSIITYYSAHL